MRIQAKTNFSTPGHRAFQEGEIRAILQPLADELISRGLACKVADPEEKAPSKNKNKGQKKDEK